MRFWIRTAIQNTTRCLAVASMAWLVSNSAWGCERCGTHTSCDATCGVDAVACDSMGCNSCGRSAIASRGGAPDGPIFKTLDALAGGIEKVVGLNKCKSRKTACDACDAAMISELSAPPMSGVHSHPVPQAHSTSPRMPTVPPENYVPQTAPRSTMQVKPYVEQPLAPVPESTGEGETVPRTTTPRTTEPRTVTPLQPLQDTTPRTTEPPTTTPGNDGEKGSIFDNLDDPFGDDNAQARPTRQFIQRASYQGNRQTAPSLHQQRQRQSRAVPNQHTRPAQNQSQPKGLLHQLFGTRKSAASAQSGQLHHAGQQLHPVNLQRAPSNQRQHASSSRIANGQRHSALRSGGYGHTTAR